jgi:hypothetical protein
MPCYGCLVFLAVIEFFCKAVNVDFGMHTGQVSSAFKGPGPTESHSAPLAHCMTHKVPLA